jgi:acyl dehydratase
MIVTARQLHFEAVKVGDELPPLVKPPVDRLQIARYVGASGDFNPLSCDEVHAKNSGFPSLIAPGMLGMGFLAELVVDWVRGARLKKFQARFVKIVWPGDVLTARGRVVDRRFEEGGRYAIDIEAWAENQRGELAVRGLATVQLYYNADDETRQRAGGAPLLVTPQEEEARLAKLSRAQPQRPAPKPAAAAPPVRPAVSPPAKPAIAAVRPAPAPTRPAPAPAARPAATPVRAAPPPKPTAPVRAAPPPKPTAPAPARPAAAKPPPPKPAAPVRASAPAKPSAAKPTAAKPTAAKAAVARPVAAAKTRVPAKPAVPARPAARARPAAAGKGKAAARAAKRPASKDKVVAARGRSRGAAKKPSGKKRR